MATHMRPTVYPSGSPPTGWTAHLSDWLNHGHVGVVVFIVISGYSLAIGVINHGGRLPRGAVDFWQRRATRILPAYYAALGFSLLLIIVLIHRPSGTVWDVALPVTTTGVLSHLVLLQDLREPFQIDYPLWTIAVEAQLYVLLPLLIVLRHRLGWPALLAGATAVALIGLTATNGSTYETLSPQLLGPFVFGYCAADLSLNPELRTRLGRFPWLAAASAVGLLTLVGLRYIATPAHVPREDWLDVPTGIAIALMLVGIGRRPTHRLCRALRWRPLVAVGVFSYSLYLIHAPLEQVLWQYGLAPLGLARPLDLALMLLVGAPLIVGCAYGFFRLVEQPSMAARQREERAVGLASAPA